LRALTQLILSFIAGRQLQGGVFFQLLVRQGRNYPEMTALWCISSAL